MLLQLPAHFLCNYSKTALFSNLAFNLPNSLIFSLKSFLSLSLSLSFTIIHSPLSGMKNGISVALILPQRHQGVSSYFFPIISYISVQRWNKQDKRRRALRFQLHCLIGWYMWYGYRYGSGYGWAWAWAWALLDDENERNSPNLAALLLLNPFPHGL